MRSIAACVSELEKANNEQTLIQTNLNQVMGQITQLGFAIGKAEVELEAKKREAKWLDDNMPHGVSTVRN